MKRMLRISGLILCWILFLQSSTYAQSRTKCPPKAKKWKSKERRELVKFPSLLKSEKEQAKAERRLGYTPREKEKKAKNRADKKENYYVKKRGNRNKQQKLKPEVASTKCPPK